MPFPRAGLYEVAVAGFDPSDPERFTDVGPPVRIEPALAPVAEVTAASGDSWLWTLAGGAALAALLAVAVSRSQPRRSSRSSGTA